MRPTFNADNEHVPLTNDDSNEDNDYSRQGNFFHRMNVIGYFNI